MLVLYMTAINNSLTGAFVRMSENMWYSKGKGRGQNKQNLIISKWTCVLTQTVTTHFDMQLAREFPRPQVQKEKGHNRSELLSPTRLEHKSPWHGSLSGLDKRRDTEEVEAMGHNSSELCAYTLKTQITQTRFTLTDGRSWWKSRSRVQGQH